MVARDLMKKRKDVSTDRQQNRQTESKTDKQGRQMSGWMDGWKDKHVISDKVSLYAP